MPSLTPRTEIRLPDYRGRFVRSFDGVVGNDPDKATRASENGGPSGNNVGSTDPQGSGRSPHRYNFNASTQVPTGLGNRPKNITALYIIKF